MSWPAPVWESRAQRFAFWLHRSGRPRPMGCAEAVALLIEQNDNQPEPKCPTMLCSACHPANPCQSSCVICQDAR